jgi:hypothetical protein
MCAGCARCASARLSATPRRERTLAALATHGRGPVGRPSGSWATYQYDLTCDSIYPSCFIIQENIIFDRAMDRFSLEVLTPMGGVVLDIGT